MPFTSTGWFFWGSIRTGSRSKVKNGRNELRNSYIPLTKDLRENNLNKFATRYGSDWDGTIEEKPRHSRAMLRFFRLRRVQRWPEDWMRNVQVISSQVLSKNKAILLKNGLTRGEAEMVICNAIIKFEQELMAVGLWVWKTLQSNLRDSGSHFSLPEESDRDVCTTQSTCWK